MKRVTFRRFWLLTVTGLLTACAPQAQDFDPAPKQHARFETEMFRTADDASLPYRRWLPEKKPKAVIIALHGMNDYGHAFEYSGDYFSQHGIAVYAYDQRGFGKAPYVGKWAGEQNLINDLKQWVEQAEVRYPHTPIYILGESMGGAVAIAAVADPSFPKVDGLILSAPAVWGAETMNPIYRGTLWLAAHTFPFKELTGSDLKIIASNNYPMLRALAGDPLIIKRTRIDAIYGMVHLMDSAYEKVPGIHTPTLLLYGGKDQVIPPHPIVGALMRFTEPVQYAYYPKGYHMLLRDLQRESVMEDIVSWIKQPGKPLPSGFGKTHFPSEPVQLESAKKSSY